MTFPPSIIHGNISITFNFSVRHPDAPICGASHEELLGALKHETLTLKCEVNASPPADSFHWTFNSSGEPTDLPARLHSSEVWVSLRFTGISFLIHFLFLQTGFSRLNYTPASDLDYGTISCWGRNAIGMQKSPCIFQIVAAGKTERICCSFFWLLCGSYDWISLL